MEEKAPNGNGNGNAVGRALQTWAPLAIALIAVLSSIGSYYRGQGSDSQTLTVLQGRVDSLTGRTNSHDHAIQSLQIAASANCEQHAKIETQFGTVETIINKDNVDNQRHKDAVNAKLFGITPSGIYYEIKIPHEVVPCSQ